jgi:hypothetical protein
LYAWGAAHNGELGTGKRLREMRPVLVEMEEKFSVIQAGYEFSLAIAENGASLVEFIFFSYFIYFHFFHSFFYSEKLLLL